MKSDLKMKFLGYMAQRKKGEGFTLIELLVVIIIIGILAAIALPSFLNQSNKAKQSESKQYVGTLVRSQQAYFLEKNGFASNIVSLGSPIASETTNYSYNTMTISNDGATNENVVVNGVSKAPALKSYTGMVQLNKVTETSEATTFGVVCESNSPGAAAATAPTASSTEGAPPTCTAGTSAL
ncbi:type IV pilin-like G/H family protein [filamentous cyanobacterium LEGE 11480]|uniref:Type IV pilin-like G/H family protein n=1 Tax=Romeriopsis navalis LEGE 11480 TaxID=2777977 RepID=A0A928VMQ7_9CYAN|nr:type IV pilin-like G/H family protein [Romeriopsis navalis]MBE9031453.1 type IV pilin-like G/H family protein [Romeriopsis navalis LEGE 11480]